MLEVTAQILLGVLGLATASAFLIGDNELPDEQEEPDVDQAPKDQPDPEKLVEVEAGEGGVFIGSDLSETLRVEIDSDFETTQLWDKYEEEVNPPLDIRGGEGDDLLILHGRGYIVRGDDGADTIEMGEAAHIGVFAGEDDIIVGGSGEGNYFRLDENATFYGGSGDDLVHSSSTSDVHLGDGNDTFVGLRSTSGGGHTPAQVFGGSGNDHLVGSVLEENLWWEHADGSGYLSIDQDSLYGGIGEDTLVGSHGDLFEGGLGNDTHILFLRAKLGVESATITDFELGSDRLEVRYEYFTKLDVDGSSESNITHDDFRLLSDSEDGSAICDSDGNILVRFSGLVSLQIGVQLQANLDSTPVFVDLNGHIISAEDCDVVIRPQAVWVA